MLNKNIRKYIPMIERACADALKTWEGYAENPETFGRYEHECALCHFAFRPR